ncbi:acyl CoA binding protein-domain-containing protein [Desarmillaria tabescens]|uniref:Acyl CoA binding protein-domain-containing protein n=1 Tax=Armillaria tabescens TaxID=1929756 RepID=A0AA39NFY7_ARMTA|nr:acyl CoA binding protein-domain-containing protein [Desarmillaria tabescens]KAK0464919.1 acyl CoA binding protein-domain-containing protein [Desarmillaria tabescens]
MSPSKKFDDAASYLSNAPSLAGLSSSTRLELYGLFKYVTVGASPGSSRPSIFDMTGRAKWDAWNASGKKWPTAEQAEARYLELAQTSLKPPKAEPKPDDDDIWDDDSTAPKSGQGLGVAVSSMAGPVEVVGDDDLHGLAVSNQIAKLAALDEYGYTALHLAADRGNTAIVKILLDHGANAVLKDSDGFSASELARIAGHSDIVQLLSS